MLTVMLTVSVSANSASASQYPVSYSAAASEQVRSVPPLQIPFLGAVGEEWEIVQVLPLTVERADDLFIVSDSVFYLYGEGDSVVEALHDYKLSLLDYHDLLESHCQDNEASERLFKKLRSYLRRLQGPNADQTA